MICARSEVGLSRLPVTEEIAGSNPVERATDNSPLDRVFFYEKYSIFIAFMCNLCYDIANWTGKSKEFYNKIPDNVRERTPSVMVYNPNNPSGSPENSTSRRNFLKGIIAVGATAAFAISGCSAEKVPEVPETKQNTPASTEQSSIGTEPVTKSPTPETQEIKMEFVGLEDFARNLSALKKEFENATEEEKQKGEFYTKRMALLIGWSHANHGFKSKTFDYEKGAWKADAGNYKEVQDEVARSIMTLLYDIAVLTHACNEDNSLLPPETGITADDVMAEALDAFTGGYAKSKLKGRLNNFKEYPVSIKTSIYGGTIEEGKLIEPFASYYGTRTRNNFNDKDAKDPDADLLSSGGMNAGGTHDTYDFFVPSDMGDDIKRVLKLTVLIVNTESEDIHYANEPAEKPGNGYGAPAEGQRAYIYGTLVDARVTDKTCTDGISTKSIHIVDGDKERPICDLPELQKYYAS